MWFFNASSDSSGAVMGIHSLNSELEIIDCIFSKSVAKENGGALFMVLESTGALKIANTIFRENTAHASGGSIYISKGSLNMKKTSALSKIKLRSMGAGRMRVIPTLGFPTHPFIKILLKETVVRCISMLDRRIV